MAWEPGEHKSYYNNRKQAYMHYLGGLCAVCGSTDELEFDHLRWQDKSFSIMSRWGSADQDAVYKELDKCQLLCKTHHKEKTRLDQGEIQSKPTNHGTIYAWMKEKCACDICQASKRLWYDERNAKRRSTDSVRGPYNQLAEHGTYKRYKRGCKCLECKAANALRVKELRNKQ